MNNRTIKIAALLLMGLVGGCSSSDGSPTDNNIVGAVVDSSGNPVTCCFADQSSNDDHLPQVAYGGGKYLVVYERAVSDDNHDIIGVLITPSSVTSINIDTSGNDDQAPRVASDGTDFLVVYEDDVNNNIIGKRVVSATGAVLASLNIDTSGTDSAPAVAFDGGNYLVVYESATGSDHDIVGTFVNMAGVPASRFDINGSSTNDDTAPALTFDNINSKYLVVYEDATGSIHDIIGTLITGGVPGTPFVIGNTSNDLLAPAVAFGGGNYLVVYQETISNKNHDIIGAQISPIGTELVGSPFSINPTSSTDEDDAAPSVAFITGANFLVAYQETTHGNDHDIMGNIVTPTTPAVVSGIKTIDNFGFNEITPAVATDKSSYFVVYEEVF